MTIRTETDGAGDLAQTARWLMRHRGRVLNLDGTRRLTLGAPISGARSVIVAAVLQDGESTPQLGGVVRALASRYESEPARLVFEGRSPAGMPRAEAEAVAVEVLERIARLVVDRPALAEVA